MLKFKTPYTYQVGLKSFEHLEGDSITIQGEAYTIKELMLKNATGNMPPIMRNPRFQDGVTFDDDDLNELQNMSQMDKQILIDNNRQLIQQLAETNRQHQIEKAKQKELEAKTKSQNKGVVGNDEGGSAANQPILYQEPPK